MEEDIAWTHHIFEVAVDAKHKVLFNMLTGAIDIVNNSLYEKIKTKGIKNIEIDKFIERGYCFHSKYALQNTEYKIQHLIQQRESKTLYKFVIIPNYTCNFACDYCYEMDATTLDKKMSSDDLGIIFQIIENIISERKKSASITLMGGEPLLPTNFDIVDAVLKFASSNGLKVVVITNGGTLTEYILEFVKYSNFIAEIQVTLDGMEKIHDLRRPFRDGRKSFSLIMEGIDKAIKNNLNISIRINLDKRNVNYIHQLTNFLLIQPWSNSSRVTPYFYPMSDGGCLGNKYIVEEAVIFRRLLKKLVHADISKLNWFGFQFHGIPKFIQALKSKYTPCLKYCDATMNQYVFDPFGYIYKCWFGVRNSEEFAVGRYKPQFIIDRTKEMLWYRRSGVNLPKCRQCKFLYICGGGCAEKAWEQHKSFLLPKCPDFKGLLSIYTKFIWHKTLQSHNFRV
jgi:uncharacterized protein